MKIRLVIALLLVLRMGMTQNPADPAGFRQFHLVEFKLGLNRLQVLDRNSSSLVYQGNIPTLGFTYEGSKNGNHLLGSLQLGRGSFFSKAYPDRMVRFRSEDIYGTIDSVSVPMRGNNTLARLSLGYLRQIGSPGKLDYELGAIVSNDVYYPQGFLQPGLMNVASVSPVIQFNYLPEDRHCFSIKLSIPLFSLVSRSTYNNSVSQPVDGRAVGFLDQGSRWESLRKHRQIDISAAYHFRLGDRWRSGLHYNFRLLKNTLPRDLTLTQNEVALSMQVFR